MFRLMLFYMAVGLLLVLFQYIDLQGIRAFLRTFFMLFLLSYVYFKVGVSGLKEHGFLFLGIFINFFFISYLELLQHMGQLTLGSFFLLVSKLLMLYQIYHYPHNLRRNLNKVHYFLIPLFAAFVFDCMYIIDELPGSATFNIIALSISGPIMIGLSLFMLNHRAKWFFFGGAVLLGIIDLWETYFHFIDGRHFDINLWGVVNMLPYVLLVFGVIETDRLASQETSSIDLT